MEDEQEAKKLLAKFRNPIAGVPLQMFIETWFGFSVIKFDEKKERKLLKSLIQMGKKACVDTHSRPIQSGRPNEVGNKMEPVVKAVGRNLGLKISSPSGSGYPDLRIDHGKQVAYIEVKTYSKRTKGQGFRSFYLSPSKNPRIKSDGYHLLLGFEVEKLEDGRFRANAFDLIDCYDLPCNIKFEANTSNAVLYSDERVICKHIVRSDDK